ncbi:MAG: 50S ribosomal protein L30 [Desulfobacteria bacterium]|nr:50S ribosomal protein L30 [Deltaproteobacteria bacterium]MDL1978852.1 50S ribosomal protein L30 [Deltaproteobacteria bacterium]OEU56551.1 MAG: 50S ribosomal protein L30 [Desulfobacterales bacterium C00003106]OEU59984.1 MAG: 50S ribosomal protein L30 [Desulfobacterales bacterium C00003104]
MSQMIKITLRKSVIGRPEKHRRVVRAMGLRKLNRSVVVKDSAVIQGMIKKVSHLLEVEEHGNEA